MRRKPLCGLMMGINTVLIAQKKIGHGIMRKWDMSNDIIPLEVSKIDQLRVYIIQSVIWVLAKALNTL